MLCLFVVVLAIGIASGIPSERPVTSWESTTIHAATITIQTQLEFNNMATLLDGNMSVDEHILIDPTEAITGTLQNFAQDSGFNLEFSANCDATTNITLNSVTNNGLVRIYGSPKVYVNQCDIQNNFYIYNSPTVNVANTNISNTALPVTINVDGAATILFSDCNITGKVDVTGVSGDPTVEVTFDNCRIEGNTTLKGNELLTYLQDCTLTDWLIVESESTTTIQNTGIIGGLDETISPTLIPDETSISMPYNFVFEPEKTVSLSWSGSDNIVGAAYTLTYRVVVYQDGQVVQNFTQSGTTAEISVKTASPNQVHVTSIDAQGNVSSTAIISIVQMPNVLWFIMMIVLIAGGAVAVLLIMYLRKQRQWQKTTLMEIPT